MEAIDTALLVIGAWVALVLVARFGYWWGRKAAQKERVEE